MKKKYFSLHHINATAEDVAGNGGIGRYILLPGSDGRAKEIAQQFDNLSVKQHPRGHNFYMGTISCAGKTIDVAAVASGMGCPSMEIVLHELFQLGGKRFLRVGTAGSMQPMHVKLGDIVNVHASVRDESTTKDYAPIEMPAVASVAMTAAIMRAAATLSLTDRVHQGTVHCKASLYAREFDVGPMAELNAKYMHTLAECGVLATEMETAALLVQSQIYHHQLRQEGNGPEHNVLCGAILGIIAVLPDQFVTAAEEVATMKRLIDLAFASIRALAVVDA